MAEMRDVQFRKIDLDKELYIHYHLNNYLEYRNKKNYQISVDWPLIAGIYGKAATE